MTNLGLAGRHPICSDPPARRTKGGDLFLLLQQGKLGQANIGSGTFTSDRPFHSTYLYKKEQEGDFLDLKWHFRIHPERERPLRLDKKYELIPNGFGDAINWNARRSGEAARDQKAAMRALRWFEWKVKTFRPRVSNIVLVATDPPAGL